MEELRRRAALTRRSVLAGLGTTAAGASLSPRSWGAGNTDVDVLVVGAGAAAIGAAQALGKTGLRWMVVEASGRVGGRAYTDVIPPFPGGSRQAQPVAFDFGCAWIHASNETAKPSDKNPFEYPVVPDRNSMYRLANYLSFGTKDSVDLEELGKLAYACAVFPDHKAVEAKQHQFEAAVADWVKNPPPGHSSDEAVSHAVTELVRPMDAVITEKGPMDAAVDLQEWSTLDASTLAAYDKNFLVKEGYGSLVLKTADEVRHRSRSTNIWVLNTKVTKIDCTANPITAQMAAGPGGSNGSITAKAVIVTASTGVLRKGDIKFVGLSSAIQSAIGDLPMGLLAKIPLVVPGIEKELQQFLPEGDGLNQTAAVIGGRPGINSLYFVVHPWNPALVIGFVGGSYAWDLSQKGAAGIPEAVRLAQQKLGEILGCGSARIQPEAATLTDWGWNPNTLGGYTAAAPGHFAARATLGTSQDNRLYFAGEALGKDGWYATCHGAYDSGYEVAIEAIKNLSKT